MSDPTTTGEKVFEPPLMPDPENRIAGQPFLYGWINGLDWWVPSECSYRLKSGEVSTVQKNFVFNFADIPRLLFGIYPPAGNGKDLYGIASMWHDWLLEHKAIGGRLIQRSEADDLFMEIMTYLKVRPVRASIMYKAVCLNTWQKKMRGIPFQPPKEPSTNEGNAT